MKLIVQYLNKVGFAADLQSIVSLVFFLLFLFILYIILRGNNREYKSYGDFPLEEDTFSKNDDSPVKIQ
jgi:cbb3-type cytochrome oxidase subunit 3